MRPEDVGRDGSPRCQAEKLRAAIRRPNARVTFTRAPCICTRNRNRETQGENHGDPDPSRPRDQDRRPRPKDEAFRKQIISEPNAARAEIEKQLGQKLPANFKVEVFQETADRAYLVIPPLLDGVDSLTDAQLESVASGDGNTVKLPCMFFTVCVTTNNASTC